jgi:uncharacterized protein YqgC (DUF456 family)
MAVASLYYLAAVCLVILCCLAWLTTLLTLPGNWFVVALAALFAWWFPVEAGRGIAWQTVGIAAALAAIGEVIEFTASAAGAAKHGASRRAVALSLLGAMLGSFAGLVIGIPIPILGPLIVAVLGGAAGAFAGAYIGETWKGRTESEKIAAGHGAFMGRIWGTLGKLAIGAAIVALVAIDAFI